MRKIHMTRQSFEASSPQGHFQKNKKHVFRYGLGECLYRISGLYLFSLWPKCAVETQYLQGKMGIFTAGCSPHVDFENNFMAE